jgi:hypothetical protein
VRLGQGFEDSAPHNSKRRAFYSTVYTAALTGLTAATPTQNQTQKIDNKLAGYMQKMLKGAATWGSTNQQHVYGH